MQEFYRVSEVMEILNLGRTKTYELIRAGVIPSVDIGGSKRVPAKLLREKIETIISTCNRNESANAEAPATDDSASRHRLPSTRGT
jgi:excisionase family DNA binding protein